MANVTIIGAGAMGSALTVPLIKNEHKVNLWGTELDEDIITDLRKGRPHPKHKVKLPEEIETFRVDELEAAMQEAEIVIMAITSDALAKIFKRVIPFLKKDMIVASVSKGFEYNNENEIVILPEILKELLPDELKDEIPLVVVGGPSKAIEVVLDAPTSVTYASDDEEAARYLQEIIQTDVYNVEISTDVLGVEVCAAVKNSYAIGLGLADGFEKQNSQTYSNTKSAIFTFAVAEMKKLVEILGGEFASVIGLPGVGDLQVTGEAGRNRGFGEVVGSGITGEEAIQKMREDDITVEGYRATRFAYELATRLADEGKLDLNEVPLLSTLYGLLYENEPSLEKTTELLNKCTDGFYN